MIRTIGFPLALTAAVSAAGASAAPVGPIPAKDGALPIYAGAKPPSNNDYPENFWTSGAYRELAFLTMFTQDGEATVDGWYRSRLGPYKRTPSSKDGVIGAKFDGPGGRVTIMTTGGTPYAQYGKTMILMIPGMKSQ